MGYEKFTRPILARGAKFKGGTVQLSGTNAELRLPVETKTGTSVAQLLLDHGVSILTYGTSGKTNDFILPPPPAAGTYKKILLNKNTSSEELNITQLSSAGVFFGTTFDTITVAASTVNTMGSIALELVGTSTTSWAVTTVGSTIIWDFSASTGSTDS